MSSYHFRPSGVCSQDLSFDLVDGKLHNVAFVGGCNGNLKAIGKLLEGADAQSTVDTLMGNLCGYRGTSCADQLAKAVSLALERESK